MPQTLMLSFSENQTRLIAQFNVMRGIVKWLERPQQLLIFDEAISRSYDPPKAMERKNVSPFVHSSIYNLPHSEKSQITRRTVAGKTEWDKHLAPICASHVWRPRQSIIDKNLFSRLARAKHKWACSHRRDRNLCQIRTPHSYPLIQSNPNDQSRINTRC